MTTTSRPEGVSGFDAYAAWWADEGWSPDDCWVSWSTLDKRNQAGWHNVASEISRRAIEAYKREHES